MNTEQTARERLAALQRQHEAVTAEIDKIKSAGREQAIADVWELIAQWGLTRAECESPTWKKQHGVKKPRKQRSDVGKPRGPRKVLQQVQAA